MKTAHPPDEGEPYGYGLDIHPDGFGHGGDMLGYVANMRADTATGIGVVAFVNGYGGAWGLSEGALAIATGRRLPDLDLDLETPEPLADDGTCPADWTPYLGRFRAHNPWLPTFSIAAAEAQLVMGIDWSYGSERQRLTARGPGEFRVGEPEWSPERLRFDTVIDGRAQRAFLSGTPYYRAFTA